MDSEPLRKAILILADAMERINDSPQLKLDQTQISKTAASQVRDLCFQYEIQKHRNERG